jgi:hypothetical protein
VDSAERQCLTDSDFEWSDDGRQFTVLGTATALVLIIIGVIGLVWWRVT